MSTVVANAYSWFRKTLPQSPAAWMKILWTVGLFVGGSVAIYHFETVKEVVIGSPEGTDSKEGPEAVKTEPPPM
eukprot:CAMPEP_0184498792 /NCGR_PEP_ID=MMETSP0113_2-20130426/39865_1 /TAXON_ID=91329 /ORGANISM="Norrisiella sphaerica, Strain BC52" /LENGTH=73 /DNA_ID=CAMNT_0026886449 /DNA_START=103 /DNA_END=324 /DNA_ORIENTATION=+